MTNLFNDLQQMCLIVKLFLLEFHDVETFRQQPFAPDFFTENLLKKSREMSIIVLNRTSVPVEMND